MNKISLIFIVALILCSLSGPAHAAPTEIKIAVVMPEGSTWTNTLHDFADAVAKETKGEVAVKIYAGGVSGDEVDVLRKMRVNRLHAGGFSGVGLGMVLPEIRVLEAPLLFDSYEEVDYVKERMFDDFAARFEEKGYVLLGFAEAGFVYLFSQRPLSSVADLKQTKMWVWKGDRVAENFLEAFGVQGYPLQLADVNTGLDTRMIDSFYSPPLAAVAFQWYARVRYLLDFPMVNSTGALLMTKSAFYRLKPENREIVSRLVKQYSAELVRLTRRDNDEAMQVIQEAGIERIAPTSEQIASFQRSAQKNYEMSVPSLYSQELLDRIRGLIAEYRAGKK
ncbi:C4-dicarboxylate ABC transporter [Desulfosarcina widdelii]|uniref:C4-dicarboxylate ABC transporter n=1 Tax=Desulfosarcina widdelii TaxID=947919 RepID=A0A5K7YV49_9BACT|nr:TRAP transporter substrate-binding protein DctP [Desulfosarcina widdelii]BBO73652.1 C4-dicarboxylate ABC transporter [Desulfosarcina widdelii]